jgi:hypothetical protein
MVEMICEQAYALLVSVEVLISLVLREIQFLRRGGEGGGGGDEDVLKKG